jgi:hypothetical protein
MKLGQHILLFSAAIFVLTTVGLVVVYVWKHVPFWLSLAYIFICPLVFAFAVDFLVGGNKLSGKKVLLLTVAIMVTAATLTSSVWTIVAPRWSFSVSTEKLVYRLGEDVQITASLENLGFISHSFASATNDPVVVSIETPGGGQVWYSPYHLSETEFTLAPYQTLIRTFTWNQTNIHSPEKQIESGHYYIRAFIPGTSSETWYWNPLFRKGIGIDITAT